MIKVNRVMLPSAITLGNLFCGFLAISYIADGGRIEIAAWLILLGMVFDMLDGKVARLTNGSSEFGTQLDSLTDMITFGVAPAFLIKTFIIGAGTNLPAKLVWGICLLYVMCAAIRLARFNVQTDLDEESHKFFQGLATPAGAGVLVSMILVAELFSQILTINSLVIAILAVTTIVSFLMVSDIRYVHGGAILLKKGFGFTKFIVLCSIVTGIVFNLFAYLVSLSFGIYALSGPAHEVKNFLEKRELASNVRFFL